MKSRVKIFGWSESRNTSTINYGNFDSSRKVTMGDIETARRKREKKKSNEVRFVVTTN